MKRLFAILVSTVLIVGFACAQTKPFDGVKLTYMTWDYADRTKSTDAFIAAVKEKFGITIEMTNVPTNQYSSILKVKLASQDVPDFVKVHNITASMELYNSKIDPDLFMDISSLPALADYIPSVQDNLRRSGKLYYAVISTNALGGIYNKKVFKDLGLSLPKSYPEFLKICEKIKAAGISPIAGGFKDAWTSQIVPFIGANQFVALKTPTAYSDIAYGKKKLGDFPGFTQAFQVQSDLIAKGFFSKNAVGTDVNMAGTLVATGKAAMLIVGTWQYTAVRDAAANPNDIGFMAIPLNPASEPMAIATNANEGICIYSKTKNAEAAKAVMNYYLSQENQERVIAEINGIPTNTKVVPTSAFQQEVSAVLKTGTVLPMFFPDMPQGTKIDIEKTCQENAVGVLPAAKVIKRFDDAMVKGGKGN